MPAQQRERPAAETSVLCRVARGVLLGPQEALDLAVLDAVLSQESTQVVVVEGHSTCGPLHLKRRLDALSFVRLQALLQVVDELSLARPRLALVVAETGPERGSLVLGGSVNT